MKRNMKITSQYRKKLLYVIGQYHFLPSNVTMIVSAYPFFENEEKLNTTYRHMSEKHLVQKIKTLNTSGLTRNQKDTIVATELGKKVMTANDIKTNQLAEGKKASTKQRALYYAAECEIFFRAFCESTNDKFKNYLNRQMIQFALKNSKIINKKILLAIKGTRVYGLWKTPNRYFRFYNVQEYNIRLITAQEENLVTALCTTQNITENEIGDSILLAKNVETINKYIDVPNEQELEKKVLETKYSRNTNRIFDVSGTYYDFEHLKYFVYNSPEQTYILNFLLYSNVRKSNEHSNLEHLIQRYIIALNPNRHFIAKKYGNTVYESDEEIAFEIVTQELNKLKGIVVNVKAMRNGYFNEKRKIVIYGCDFNKKLYNRLFSKYGNIEFRYLNKNKLLEYVKARVDE